MAEHSIIFSAPMIQALLEGRKTQTRRLAWRETWHVPVGAVSDRSRGASIERRASLWQRVQPGDRLWVREAYATTGGGPIRYYATDDVHDLRKRRSPIYMPRWASRITLIVTEVRLMHLQDINLDDALAEGAPVDPTYRDTTADGSGPPMVKIATASWHTPRAWFHTLWTKLHGPDAWDNNPEVIALTFTVEQRNIDRA